MTGTIYKYSNGTRLCNFISCSTMRLKALLLSFSVVDEKYYAATSSIFVYTTKLNTFLLLLVAVVLHLFLNCTTKHALGVTMSECNKPIIINDTLQFTLLYKSRVTLHIKQTPPFHPLTTYYYTCISTTANILYYINNIFSFLSFSSSLFFSF